MGPQHYHNDAIGRHGQHADIAEYSSVEKIDPKLLITHRFRLENILDAYETLGSAANTKALKVIIEA